MRKLKLFFACLLMAVFSIGQMWGDTQRIVFSSYASNTVTDDQSNSWSTSGTIGSSELPADTTLTTAASRGVGMQAANTTITSSNEFSNVTSVRIDYSYNKTVAAALQVFVGNTQIGSDCSFNSKQIHTKTTFTSATPLSGAIQVKLKTRSQGTIWVGAVTVITSGGGGGDEPGDPSLSVSPTSWDFGDVASSDAASKEFSVSGSNLTAGTLTISVPEGFLVSPSSISVTEATLAATAVTVSKNTTDINDYSGNLSFSGCGLAEAKTVALEMSVVADPEPTGTFAPFSGDIAEGDYLIIADGAGMNTTVSGNRLQYEELTKTGGNYVNPSTSLIWHIAASATDGYWTIYNDEENQYAAATSSNNQAQMLESGTDDKSLWSITHSGANYTITNKSNSRYLKKNGTYGFACYADGTVTLYKKQLPTHAVTFTDAPTGGSVAVSVGGSDISSGDQVEEGATVTITPTASTYYQIASVTQGGQAIEPVQGVYSFTMPSSDVAVAATFEYIPVTGLTLNKAELELLVDAEDALSVTAVTPSTANPAVTWSSSDEDVVVVDENGGLLAGKEGTATITATSVVSGTVTATCAVTVSAPSGHAIGITSANGTVTANSGVDVADVLKEVEVVLTATPNDGYSISGWTVVGTEYSVSQDKTTCSFTMPDDEVLVEVTYTHEVAVLKLHDAAGVTEFDGDHFWKEEVTLPNTAAACSKIFVGWSAESNHSSAPELGATYVLPNKGENHIYAVYATANGGDTDVEFNAGEYAAANSWANGTAYTDFTISGVNFKANGGGNNGKYYTSDKSWRMYNGGSIAITASANIVSVTSTPSKDFTINGTSASLSLSATTQFTSITVTVVGETTYSNYSTTCQQQAAAPTFSVEAGTYYVAQNNIVLASTTENATIYYTTDGSDPKTSGTKQTYSGAINLSERAITTIKAYAVAEGYENSEIAEAEYNINLPYDFADFAALTKENGKEYAVRGIISEKGTLTNANQLPYYISANGTTDGQIKCHNGLGLNKAPFTSADDVNLGDNVTVVGTWSGQYKNIDGGNWMLEYTARQAANPAYEIVGNLTTSNFDADEEFDTGILANLSVNALFTNGYKEAVDGVTFTYGEKATWEAGDETLTVTAVKNEENLVSKDFDVTVTTATLESIALKADDGEYQTKKVYYVGEDFVAPTIVATLSDETTIEAVATYVSGFDNANAGVQNVTVSYTRGAVTETTTYYITMKAVFDNEDDPHTVAEALYIINNIVGSIESTGEIVVTGTVSEEKISGNINRYKISDGTNELLVYAGKGFNKANFTEANYPKVGDAVVVKGNVINYSGNTPEFVTGKSYLLSQLRTGVLDVEGVTEFEVGQPDLAEADLTINRNGSNGAITFSCDENDALEVVENGTKLRAKGEATADVTVTATMAADNTEGQINFTEASTTFTVHVVPAQTRYAVTFDMNGGSADPELSLGDQLENANVVIPAGTFTKDGYKFNGWAVTYIDANEQVQNVTVTENAFTMPAAAVTVTAQWAEGSEANWVAATWASANNISSNTNLEGDYATIAVDANVSLTWSKATGNNVPAYNSSNTEARLYQNTTLQVAGVEGKLIKKVTFTFRGNNTGTISASVGTYSSNEWIGLANAITFTNTGSAAYIKSIAIEYINGTVTSLTIANINLKLSDGETALTITKNVDATIIYEGLDESVATIADNKVTPVAEGSTTVTARIAQGSNYTAAQTTFTITVAAKTIPEMSFPQAEYNANLGGSFTAPTLTKPEGVSVAYSSDNAAVSVDANTGAITINAEGTAVITATSVENDDYSVGTASYTLHVIDPTKDVLTASAIEAGSSYVDWSNKTFGSTVKYAGNSMTGSGDHAGAIQMRNTNPSGIVTTSAIGYLKSISATETSNGNNTLEIYAKGSAYESSADLYSSDEAVKGVKIGTIGKDGGAMTFVDGKAYGDNYKYIGIKANGGAVYYDAITITWTPAEFASYNVTYLSGEATGDDIVESIEEGSNISLKAANTFEAPEGKIFAGWLLEGEQNVREAGSKYTVTAAATFTAQWVSVYTITYTAGDGTGEDVIVPNVQAGDYELADNTFTAPENMEFAGWKLNNAGETLAAGANYNVSGNASFTAQWSIVKQAADLAYATTSYIITRGREFEAPELTNPHGLAVTYSGNNDEVATVNATTGALTLKGVVGEVTVTATSAATDYYYAGEASYTLKVKDANLSGGWVRLTNANALVNGMNVIIAEYVSIHNGEINTMGAQNTNNRGQKVGALQNDTLISDDETPIFTLVKVGENTFAFKAADNKYLYAASSGSNHLKSQAKIDGNATWTISLSGDGKATITAQGTNSHNLMRYNSGNEIFSCYGSGQQDIALYSKTVAVSGNTNASTLDEYADVVVADGGKLVINAGTKPLGNITGSVEVNAPLQAEGVHLGVNNTMEVNSTVNVPSFSISVKLGSTGQATNVNVSGNGNIAAPEGYVDMELSDGANPDHWHSFTVPFEVDALNGIYDAETGAKLVNETNYAIMDYHGDIRANGKYGWKKYRGVLQPGVFYLITIDGETKVLRFMKKDGSSYVAGNSMEMEYHEGEGASSDFGWCGVGNQNMFNGYVPSQYNAQVLNATGTGYELIDNTQALSACIPFFIQVNVTVNLVMQTSAPSLAPRRTPAPGVERMKVFFGNENYTDKLFISASEEALNEYEIGKDLLKMTMTNTPNVAQIFGNAYGKKLCVVNAPMVNDQAEYSLTLYAPEAGEYTISAPEMEDADLYLTKDGAIIWNLSTSEYTTDFTKGNNEGYGLMLIKKAPGAATGTENIEAAEAGAQKVVINNNVYILRNEQMYDVTGKAVK